MLAMLSGTAASIAMQPGRAAWAMVGQLLWHRIRRLVEVVRATYADTVFIARRMREMDAEEIFPLMWNGRPEDLAAGICAAGGIANVSLSNGVPVAAWGACYIRPNVWSVWMFSTDRWPEVALTVTCWSMEVHDVAHRWLGVLGAVRECSVEDYGSNRKTYFCYSWTRSRLERDGGFSHVSAISPKATTGT